jgi:hypothetical protein
MNLPQFPETTETLMHRSLEGVATTAEEAELRSLLAADPALADEFEALQADARFWSSVASELLSEPESIAGPALEEALPPMSDLVRERLRGAADATWHERQNRKAPATVFSMPASVTSSGRRSSFRPAIWLALAAAVAATLVMLARILPESGAPMAKVTLLAPDRADPSPYADPVFVWDNKDADDQRYDVWVLPKGSDQLTAKALYVAKDTLSPLPLKAMEKAEGAPADLAGGDYELLICLAGVGRHAGVTRSFAIAGEAEPIPDLTATPPGQLQLTLQELLPERPGAVLMIIATLPEGKRTLPEIRLLEKAARERIGGS